MLFEKRSRRRRNKKKKKKTRKKKKKKKKKKEVNKQTREMHHTNKTYSGKVAKPEIKTIT